MFIKRRAIWEWAEEDGWDTAPSTPLDKWCPKGYSPSDEISRRRYKKLLEKS